MGKAKNNDGSAPVAEDVEAVSVERVPVVEEVPEVSANKVVDDLTVSVTDQGFQIEVLVKDSDMSSVESAIAAIRDAQCRANRFARSLVSKTRVGMNARTVSKYLPSEGKVVLLQENPLSQDEAKVVMAAVAKTKNPLG